MKHDPLSWNVFDTWSFEKEVNNTSFKWLVFDELFPLHNIVVEKQFKKLEPLLDQWNKKFEALGGDPTFINWDNFRPLRLTREEDWADWLAYLIESDDKGYFAEELLKETTSTNFISPKRVLREDPCKGYRADLIIEWQNNNFTHIEVKIGDPNLKKTYPTSEVFQNKFKVSDDKWTNYILLLSGQLSEWEAISERIDSTVNIHAITWQDISIALRKSLLRDVRLVWKAWAYAYLGAVEQILIGFSGYKLNKEISPRENLDDKIYILEKSISNE